MQTTELSAKQIRDKISAHIYYITHKEERKIYRAKYNETHKDQIKIYHKKYEKEHREQINQKRKENRLNKKNKK